MTVPLPVVNCAVVVSGDLTDVLRAGPLLRGLSGTTDEPILVLCSPAAAPLMEGLSETAAPLAVAGLDQPGPAGAARVWRELRRRRLDVVMVCSDCRWVQLAVLASGVPARVGCARGLGRLLFTDSIPLDGDGPAAACWAAMATVVGGTPPSGPAYEPGAQARAVADERLGRVAPARGRLLVAIAPGRAWGPHGADQWAPERFAHLGNRLAQRHGCAILLLGAEEDRAVADAVRNDLAAPFTDLCGSLDLAAAGAVLGRCDLLISGDSPLLHMAAAVGTASVGIFGTTSGRTRAPAGAAHRVVQARAAEGPPLGAVRVDDVLAAIEAPV